MYLSRPILVLLSMLLPNSVTAATVLNNVNIIDATGSPLQKNRHIIIQDNRISAIGSGAFKGLQSGDQVLDLDGAFVIPGLWNVHVHLTGLLPHNHALDDASHGAKVIRAGVNAMEGLRYGFTALKSVGEEGYIDVVWQQAFDEGFLMGPRVFASGEPVSPTAGHRGKVEKGADGPSEIRKTVRERVQKGATAIKLYDVEMLPDELQAALTTARSLGVPVTTHSREPATRTAVLAGIDAIEHGYNISDETIRLMAERGTYYTPTIICNLSAEYIRDREERLARLGYSNDEQVVRLRTEIAYADERSPDHALHQRQALAKAANAGVKLMIGSDSMPVGEMGWLEMEQFVLSGVSEMDTLIAATRNPAQHMGVETDLGTVEAGKLADLIVLRANPLENISNIRTVTMVFKDGISVDLEPQPGTLGFFDYFESKGAPKAFRGRSEEAAGFVREGNPYGN
jgi:imidazolonepropionase-like amidohydrolase